MHPSSLQLHNVRNEATRAKVIKYDRGYFQFGPGQLLALSVVFIALFIALFPVEILAKHEGYNKTTDRFNYSHVDVLVHILRSKIFKAQSRTIDIGM